MAFVPSSGSVVAFQSNPSVLQTLTGLMSTNASVITVGGAGVANQSVSGTLQVDVRGSVATVIIGGSIAASFTPPANQSVSGTVGASLIGLSPVSVSNFPAVQAVAPNNSSLFALQPAGSILAVSGTFTPAANQSVSGTVGASVIGHAPVVIVGGSVLTTIGNSSVQVLNFPANQSVSGTVGTTQSGTWISSIVNTVPSSVLVGASIFGQLPAGTAMLGSIVTYQGAVWNIAGSVAAVQSGARTTSVVGSVTAYQGATPWVNTNVGSIINVHIGSIINVWQNPSIVGTYVEDAAHTTADRGIFFLGVRNDTVASLAGANLDYVSHGLDSAGRTVIKPFAPGEASLIAVTSIVSTGNTASVVLFAAPGAGLRNYITDFNISNTSATTTLVGFNDADASVMAKPIAPGGGGNNHSYATPITGPTANRATTVQLFTAASVVHVTVTGFRAP